jgi:hypothetical protein
VVLEVNRIGRRTRLCHACHLGAGDRLAGARVAVGSPDCVTMRQGCALARICPHCAALVEPSAKIHLPDLRAGRLFPKVGTLARRSLVCSVLALHFSELEHGPTFWGLGAYRRDRARPAWKDWPPDSSPHEAARSSPRLPTRRKAKRALQRRALAGLSRSSGGFVIKMAPARGSAPRPSKYSHFQIARRSSGYPERETVATSVQW